MRGMGQIRELARIARPDVGVITNVGPVHLELVGTVERVAEAKAELIARAARPARACVVPAGRGGAASAPALGRAGAHVRAAVARSRRASDAIAGAAADVRALAVEPHGDGLRVEVAVGRRARHARVQLLAGAQRHQRAGGDRRRCTRSASRSSALAEGARQRAVLEPPGRGAGSSRTASSSSTIATTPTPCRCVPPSITSPPWPTAAARGAWSRCSATCASWGPAAPEFHREIGALAAEAGRGRAGRGGRARRRLRARVRRRRRTRRRTRSGRRSSAADLRPGRATWCS